MPSVQVTFSNWIQNQVKSIESATPETQQEQKKTVHRKLLNVKNKQ